MVMGHRDAQPGLDSTLPIVTAVMDGVIIGRLLTMNARVYVIANRGGALVVRQWRNLKDDDRVLLKDIAAYKPRKFSNRADADDYLKKMST